MSDMTSRKGELPILRPDSVEPKARVAILHQAAFSWVNVGSVWAALRREPAIETTVVLLPLFHTNLDWNRRDAECHLDALGVPYVYWEDIDLDTAHFDAVLFTSPYDQSRPSPYRFLEVQKRVRFTAYVPYGLEVGGGDINLTYQFDQPTVRHASAVYVRSEGAKAMFTRYCPTGDKHVVVSGHPRMDGLANLEEFQIDPELVERIGSRRAVLWNAHFSLEGDRWSTFDLLGMDVFAAFAKREDLVLLFRPHPLLWRKLVNLGLLDDKELVELRRELTARGVIIDERPDHRHAFAASCAMISDVGSFLMEYLATGKPMLYLVNPYGLGLSEEGEAVVRRCDRAENIADVEYFLDELGACTAEDMQRCKAVIGQFFADFDGSSGRRVAEHIKVALGI